MSSGSGGAQLIGLKLYGRLPPLIRQRFVRAVKPSFTVGAMTVVTRPDGAVLAVRHSYMAEWSFPGGLLNRRELPEVGAARETREEVGLAIELAGEPAVVVDPFHQVVRVIYRAGLATGVTADDARPASPEIVEVRWFRPDALAERLSPDTGEAYEALLRVERRAR